MIAVATPSPKLPPIQIITVRQHLYTMPDYQGDWMRGGSRLLVPSPAQPAQPVKRRVTVRPQTAMEMLNEYPESEVFVKPGSLPLDYDWKPVRIIELVKVSVFFMGICDIAGEIKTLTFSADQPLVVIK